MRDLSAPRSTLYATIQTQPDVVRDVLHDFAEQAAQVAELLAAVRRVFIAGTGTNSRAALGAQHLLVPGCVEAYAMTTRRYTVVGRYAHGHAAPGNEA